MEKIVVTRHKGLILYLKESGMIDEDTKIFSHITEDEVKGKHVIGVLPYYLACHATKYTEIKLRIPLDKRGKELTYDELKYYATPPRTYIVRESTIEED